MRNRSGWHDKIVGELKGVWPADLVGDFSPGDLPAGCVLMVRDFPTPERGISGGLITSGKALVYPEVTRFYGLMQRIASQVPKVPETQREI